MFAGPSYDDLFGHADDKRRKLALEFALDTRKFEIELYWKRAAYFWTLIAAAFAGYVAVSSRGASQPRQPLVLIASLGFAFSVAWYCVNRGSKYWQDNWEAHVDQLETSIMGPIYKTVLAPDSLRLWKLNGAYPFSVSKINQLLSLFTCCVWLLLLGISLSPVSFAPWAIRGPCLLVIAFLAAVGIGGRTANELKSPSPRVFTIRDPRRAALRLPKSPSEELLRSISQMTRPESTPLTSQPIGPD
jgi:hypothetical protein